MRKSLNKMIFSGKSNLKLAKELAEKTGLKLGKIKIEKFSDGETYVQIQENIKGKEIFILQSLNTPSGENLMELLIIVDALKEMKPGKIIAILPFYAYRRQEKRAEEGESITARLVAKLLEIAGVDNVILVDIHNKKTLDFFRVPAINIETTQLFTNYFQRLKLKDLLVVAPDKGAYENAQRFAKIIGSKAIFIIKKRKVRDMVASMVLSGKVKNKKVIMIDDEINTAGTISKAIDLLKKKGAQDIYAACTHSVLSGPAVDRLKRAPLKKIIVTNTISIPKEKKLNKMSVISVAPLLARVIKNDNYEKR